MNRPGQQILLILAGLLLSASMTGCTWLDPIRLRVDPVYFPPDMPFALSTERVGDVARVSWKGSTALYDIEHAVGGSSAGQWQSARMTELRPADTSNGRYVYESPVVGRPMRFRVRAVQGEERSDWSHWIVSEAAMIEP